MEGEYALAEGSSRKRIKISRDTSRPVPHIPSKPDSISRTSKTLLKHEAPTTTSAELHSDSTPCHHEQSLRTLHDDLDAMRQLITCKICQRFLYEPYSLTCGHTFCYSCLSQWMAQNQRKTCPDCRAVITEQPAPSYLIREMVLIFVSKSELLPDGETAEEHNQLAKEEAEIVAKDKANIDVKEGGLFKGSFTRGSARLPLVAIHDYSDHVDRCPQCMTEVEDGRCNGCGVRVRTEEDDLDWSTDSEEDDGSEDLDGDLIDDEADVDLGFDGNGLDYDSDDNLPRGPLHLGDPGIPPGHDVWVNELHHRMIHPLSDDEDEEDEYDYSMDGFIDDGPSYGVVSSPTDADDSEGTEINLAAPNRRGRRMARQPVGISDDYVDDNALTARRGLPQSDGAARSGYSEDRSPATTISSDSEDEDEEGPINSQRNRGRPANRRRQRPITIPSDDDDEDENDDDDDDDDDGTDTTNRAIAGGFSPLQQSRPITSARSRPYNDIHSRGRSVSIVSDDDEEDESDEDEELSDESDDDESTVDGHPH